LPLDTLNSDGIQVRDLTEQVYEALRKAILEGALRPGERLPELALARRLEVSRAPVRDALRRLAVDGLVTMIPGRGAAVTLPEASQIHEIYTVRNPLEVVAARLAAANATPEQVAELRALESEFAAATARNDNTIMFVLANRFHAAIYAAAGNSLLARILIQLQEGLVLFQYTGEEAVYDASLAHRQHTDVLEAIERHDPEAAERAMWVHMRLAETTQVDALHVKAAVEPDEGT
jgi:DNA-binding GntR family transcriptional regulator